MFSGLSASQPSTRRWTALTSFSLQATLVAAALVLPMIWPQDLPQLFFARRIFVPMPEAELHVEASSGGSGSGSVRTAPVLVVVRRDVFTFRDRPQEAATGPEPPSWRAGDSGAEDLASKFGPGPALLPALPKPSGSRTSVVMEGNLIHRVEPQYPAIARQIHLEGAVVLKAMISKEGNIEQLEVASGPGLLAVAAKEAVRQWKYRPYFLNGQPIEVETQITVNFVIGQ